ncbi:HK97 gp10 family phage protein [Lysinibacillus sp. NPDC096418]|uniref:HK97 gp10 family phage protein n=1 Tax=Lysinibacillus sp. NPDC096418 TaxID=3364138 RepID=UPI00381BCDA6
MASIGQLAAEINRQLALYANQTDETVQQIAEKTAREGVEELKVKSPKDTGEYAESWTYKKVRGKFVVHNKKHYRLTHLLEKGHAKVNGGRVAAQPHIKPVETQMVRDFEDELRRGLS